MKSDFNPEKITLPEEFDKAWLTTREFARLAGVSRSTVYEWNRAGHLRLKKFTPRCLDVPREEALRYLRGEMMEPRAEPKPK